MYLLTSIAISGAKSVVAYFPHSKWYDFHTLDVVTREGEVTIKLETPFDHFQVYTYTMNYDELHWAVLHIGS